MEQQFFDKINKYQDIVLFRHVSPDFDCLGAQMGLYEWLKDNFPSKNIYLAGDFNYDVFDVFNYEEFPVFDDSLENYLAICLDTANSGRIDGNHEKAQETIKIDHHIVVDSYGDLNIEISSSSTCEILVNLLEGYQLEMSTKAGRNFYIGIVGDSNRFMYDSTTKNTFKAAMRLLDTGITITDIYNDMYLQSAKDLEVKKYLYNIYQVDGNVAYYILNQEDLDALNIPRSKGSDYVNLFSGVREYKIWVAITQDVENNNYRISMRSRDYHVQKVATMFNGGGHLLASGARVANLEEVAQVIEKLKELITNG